MIGTRPIYLSLYQQFSKIERSLFIGKFKKNVENVGIVHGYINYTYYYIYVGRCEILATIPT